MKSNLNNELIFIKNIHLFLSIYLNISNTKLIVPSNYLGISQIPIKSQ